MTWEIKSNEHCQINFQELVIGLSILQKGTVVDKLRMAFRAFDLDNDGVIDRSEMFEFVQSASGMETAAAKALADNIFRCVVRGAHTIG